MQDTSLSSFRFHFDENNQEFVISGSARPQSRDDIEECLLLMRRHAAQVRGTFYVNVRRLVRLNNTAFNGLATTLVRICRRRPDLDVTITTSSVVGWSTRKFGVLHGRAPNVKVVQYDSEFYPGQTFVEDESFIAVLRRQTTMTWRHEKSILPRHGIAEGMEIADICCGIGDFAVLVRKEFNPAHIVALDHSKASLDYARKVAQDFGVSGIDYVYGDAAEMLLEDNQFDLVTCRHSLQVFDRPGLIVKELYRICKPGGRVYITNEKNSHCLGEPHAQSIQWTYNEVAKLWKYFNMDIEIGPKSRGLLADGGFEDIRMESFMVTNLDGDPQEFADIVTTWKHLFAEQMSGERGDDEEFRKKFRQGFDDHILAALHPKGYAGWPVWVASGRKPA